MLIRAQQQGLGYQYLMKKDDWKYWNLLIDTQLIHNELTMNIFTILKITKICSKIDIGGYEHYSTRGSNIVRKTSHTKTKLKL